MIARLISPLAGAALLAAATPAAAEMALVSHRYVCERGAEVAATYVTAADGSAAVIQVEGRQIALVAGPAASGVRYAAPSDGSGYVWWTKGEAATLLWSDGAAGAETILLAACRARI